MIKTGIASKAVTAIWLALAACAPDTSPEESGVWMAEPVKYAKGFQLFVKGDSLRIEVLVPMGSQIVRYQYSVSTAAVAPSRWAIESVTHLAFLDELKQTGRVVAVSDTGRVYSTALRRRYPVAELGEAATQLPERLLALHPDLVMVSATGDPAKDAHEPLQRAGLRVIVNADWLEAHPLGRAEWIKVFGALTGHRKQADSLFAYVEAKYHVVTELAVHQLHTPSVLSGRCWRGTWYVPGGGSYVATLIHDAGGAYLWANDTNKGSLPLSLEAVWATAHQAEIWLNPDEFTTLAALRSEEPRYANFKAFGSGQVWNKTLRVRQNGANDYWESAVARPDRVLADLLAIFHPEAMRGHQYFYYQRLRP